MAIINLEEVVEKSSTDQTNTKFNRNSFKRRLTFVPYIVKYVKELINKVLDSDSPFQHYGLHDS